jgi:hypothetical protein
VGVCSRGFFFVVVFVSRLVGARKRGRRGCGTGPAASWGLSGFAWVRAVPRGSLGFFFVSLLLFFAFYCADIVLLKHVLERQHSPS